MPHATYIGTQDDRETEAVKTYGTEFPKGEAIDISHLADHHVAKLRGNQTFVVEGGDRAPAAGPVDIQADWNTLGFQAMAALARKVEPTLDRTATKDDVMSVIEAELARREA